MQYFCLFQHKMTKEQIPRWEQLMSFISIISNITLLIIDIKDIFNLLYLNKFILKYLNLLNNF